MLETRMPDQLPNFQCTVQNINLMKSYRLYTTCISFHKSVDQFDARPSQYTTDILIGCCAHSTRRPTTNCDSSFQSTNVSI